jgi:hypothetical protein
MIQKRKGSQKKNKFSALLLTRFFSFLNKEKFGATKNKNKVIMRVVM